ncbi:MAG: helix-hairpin-helix domain-containing protein [Desulfurococcales archaeon]|nr:helix-hairpin-helix domain-containing protein [Desulfurococcales archaeon]
MASRIYADLREEKSGIPSILESMGLIVIRRNLPVGDYIVGDDVVVERKSAYDFAKSLFDGRLFNQAKRMAEAYQVTVYIVEGDPGRIRRFANRQRQLYSAMVTLTLDYNARIMISSGPQATAEILGALARRLQSQGSGFIIHKKPKLEDLQEWQLYIIQSFPQVGPKTAEKILERFQTIERFCRASISELSTVPGLGERKAENIKRILVTPYKARIDKKRMKTLDSFKDSEATGS